MLVLSREVGETVVVGDNMELTVMEVRGNRVRLSFNAPASVPIHRKELLARRLDTTCQQHDTEVPDD